MDSKGRRAAPRGARLAAVGVGAYAGANPNDVQFGAAWPAAAEMVAVLAGLAILGGIAANRRGLGVGGLVAGIVLAVIALALLALVALALSFNQA